MRISPEVVQNVVRDPANAEALRESRQLFQGIMSRSASDPDYRRQLLTDPKPAIAAHYREVFGKELKPEALAFDVRFVEPQGEFTYVLPDRVGAEAELSETELATVAGGVTPTVAFAISFAGGAGTTLGLVWLVEKIA